jgi:hypothetical protein
MFLRYRSASILIVSAFNIEYFMIWSIRYRMSKRSISSFISYLDIEGHFQTYDIESIS